jgi:hypothetical protein
VKLLNSYFAKGAMRTAHGMLDVNIGKQFVAKAYYRIKGGEAAIKAAVMQDAETQAIAKELSHAYSSNGCVPNAIDFIYTSFYELTDRDDDDPMKWIGVEPYIPGTYIKYNNNGGYVNKEFSATTQAFSHFTYQMTKGSLMVVDLQGVNHIMTDPQIHSFHNSRTKFGKGNLGSKGMAAFFATHVCNDTCRLLKLNDKFDAGSGGGGSGGDPYHDDDEDDDDDESASTHVVTSIHDGNMEMSCGLCGDIFTLKHSQFLSHRKMKKQCYCPECTAKVEKKMSIKCGGGCGNQFSFSPYWYSMVGMEHPKSCPSCKKSQRGRK